MQTKVEVDFSKEDTLVAKGLAILFLLIHHCFLWPERNRRYDIIFSPLSEEMMKILTSFSHVCVAMFVFLSAFGMTRMAAIFGETLGEKTYMDFIRKRYTKLIAGFWVIFFPALFLSVLITPEEVKVYGSGVTAVIYMIVDALGLSMLFQTPTLMGTWWYLSFAIVWIVLFPLFMLLYKKMGKALYLIVLILPYLLGIRTVMAEYAAGALRENMFLLLTPAVLGMICAEKRIFEQIRAKIRAYGRWGEVGFGLLLCIGWVVVVALHNSIVFSFCQEIVVSVEAWYAVLFSYVCIGALPGVRQVFAVIGRHSMNIFLIHDFIRARFLEDFTYSFRYAPLIILVLLVESLLCSVVIEWIKRTISDRIDRVRRRK